MYFYKVTIFLIQRNRHALIGRAMDDQDMRKILHFLKNDSVHISSFITQKPNIQSI